MRTQRIDAVTRYMARKIAPWASVLAKVEGGYLAFESFADYRTWKNQR